jgi:hypothetical protein
LRHYGTVLFRLRLKSADRFSGSRWSGTHQFLRDGSSMLFEKSSLKLVANLVFLEAYSMNLGHIALLEDSI